MNPVHTVAHPGDFAFIAGEWKISHRRLSAETIRGSAGEWDSFEGEATCWTILDGVGSVEELRIPARNFSGLGLRLIDAERRVWIDHWVNAKSGVVVPPGQTGTFADNVGTFYADELDGAVPIKVRGTWDRITPVSHRWSQAISRDGGKTWQDNWLMDWARVR